MTKLKLILSFFLLNLCSQVSRAEFVEGFPEGCYYTSIAQALPDQELRYGMIRLQGGRLIFVYPDSQSNSFLEADIAENVGKMGFDWNADQSAELMYSTAPGKYVIAQIMDGGSDLPIVTCISDVFSGKVVYGGALPYGNDYYVEYKRIKAYRWGDAWYGRFKSWKYNWSHKYRREWLRKVDRKYSRDKNRNRNGRDRTDNRPSRPGRGDKDRPNRPGKGENNRPNRPGNGEENRPNRPGRGDNNAPTKPERPINNPVNILPVEDTGTMRPGRSARTTRPTTTRDTTIGRSPRERTESNDREGARPGRTVERKDDNSSGQDDNNKGRTGRRRGR
jgi:hypothetical protein